MTGPETAGGISSAVGFRAFRIASFQAASLLSNAGHTIVPLDHALFGPASRLLFLALLFVGGCAGSTAGGLKIIRVLILGKSLCQEARKLTYPEASVLPVVIDGGLIDTRTVQSMAAMAFAWLAFSALGGLVLALNTGATPLACLSLSISALSNTGPSFMPLAEIPRLPALAKGWLIVWMIAGRLEILPVCALFSRRTWEA